MRGKAFTWQEGVVLALILLLAAGLRMGQPGITEFKRDEANLSLLALDLANGRAFPLLGIGSSVGIPNAPFNAYILAIPYWFSSSPLIATQFIGLLNVLAVLLVYVLARRYAGIWAAFIAALVYAVNPWAVIFSRKIWAQDMLPLFFLLTLMAGLLGFYERKRWAQWAFLPLLAITGQIHYGAFVILPAALWLLWIGRRHLHAVVLVGLVLAVVLTLPYVFGVVQALGSGVSLGSVVAQRESETQIGLSGQAILGAGLMIAGTEIHSLAGPDAFRDYLSTVPNAYPLFSVLSLGVALAAVWLMVKAVRNPTWRTPVDVLLLLWLIAPILMFSIAWTTFYIHYLIPVLPAAALVLGFAVQDGWNMLAQSRLRTGFFLAGGTALAAVLLLQVGLFLSLLAFLNFRHTPGGFGTPLHHLLRVREAIYAESPQQVIADVGGLALIYDDEPTIWRTLLYDVPVLQFENAETRVYPAETAVFLTNGCDLPDTQIFLRRAGEGCYSLTNRQRSDFVATGFQPISGSDTVLFANGVRLLQYRWDAPCLKLLWEITQTTTTDYQFAVHFFDENGNRIAGADGLSWPGVYWQPGDWVERQFCLAEPDERIVRVDVGMYTYDGATFANVDLLDANGAPIGQMQSMELK
ncbi:MAG: glycosyltransferase family 39 protein [bacterium]|nr:glycosyltransferase family 39 protein [bacterium]